MKHTFNGIIGMVIVIAMGVCFACGCSQSKRSSNSQALTPKTVDRLIQIRILKIAGEYKKYGRPDDQIKFAPALCRPKLPSKPSAPKIRFSESESTKTHGQKLYFLYAQDAKAYRALTSQPKQAIQATQATQASPAEQVVVKEAFTAIEAPFDLLDTAINLPLAKRDGKIYHPGDKAGLFIMYKAELYVPAAKTDQGWLYGTVSADGKKVTSFGRVANCMKCHADAPHGRLFGLAKSES